MMTVYSGRRVPAGSLARAEGSHSQLVPDADTCTQGAPQTALGRPEAAVQLQFHLAASEAAPAL